MGNVSQRIRCRSGVVVEVSCTVSYLGASVKLYSGIGFFDVG